ncbi:MAG: IS110 family transposase [bacterium]|nr:MAG: IS110 family transposase [bacterium]
MNKTITYLGIDVSKEDLENAITLNGKKIISTKKVKNNLGGFKALESWVRKHSKKHACEVICVCIESTGIYSEDVAEYFQEKEDMKVSVVNPAQVKAFGKSIHIRTKTDRVDAGLLANYCGMIQAKASPKPPEEFKDFKKLTRHRDYLVNRRAQEKSHLESVKEASIQDSILKLISFYDQQVEEAEAMIEKLLSKCPEMKKNIELLKSIPGIGDVTARVLLSELHREDETGKYNAKSQTAHAGLAPSERQSGSSIRGKSKICKTGNARLRTCLYFPALTATRYNILIASFYQRLLENGKLKKVALTASMRKLLVLAIGVLNNQVPFDPAWEEKKLNNLTFNMESTMSC